MNMLTAKDKAWARREISRLSKDAERAHPRYSRSPAEAKVKVMVANKVLKPYL